MKRGRFSLLFWTGFGLSLAAGIAVATGLKGRVLPKLPVRPGFPNTEKFVAYYAPAGSAEHNIFYYGFFGYREKIKNADIVLFGTSHVIFGISAAELSKAISNEYRRPITVLNLGMVYGESSILPAAILQRDKVRDRTVLIDLFTEFHDSSSAEANATIARGYLNAFSRVMTIWSHFASDWLLDPVLPAVHLDGTFTGQPVFQRQLGDTLFRRFANGDNAGVWIASYGERYFSDDTHKLSGSDPFAKMPNRFVSFPGEARRMLAESNDQVILLLIPFEGSRYATIPVGTLIPISSERLRYIDDHHVNAASRLLVTEQIAAWFAAHRPILD